MVNGAIVTTQNSNTPSIQTGTTALSANPARIGFFVKNLGTNPLYVLLGSGASSSVFHTVLRASAVQDDGTGDPFDMRNGCVYNGIVTVAGTSPRYTVLEIAP